MVASISARGGVQAALGYYGHLGQDDYYLRDGEPPGGWAGEGAARLTLAGPVTRSEFEAALKGIDPKTGERLAALGGRLQDHAAGWDMTFSAPKSVSALWALSEARERPAIEGAHRTAVAASTRYLEQTAAWARRGKGGATREPTAGLLMATFEHHTSRELDPQLHAHVFIFNLAPRRDGTWGAIVSRELYKAQKRAGAVYRSALAGELERAGFAVERTGDNFRVAVIPRHVERAFSKRRQAIEAAAAEHDYRSPRGMELAALRTRRPKRNVDRPALFELWRSEARARGFELGRDAARAQARSATRPIAGSAMDRLTVAGSPPASLGRHDARISHAAGKMTGALQAMNQSAAMPGIAVDLRQRAHKCERDRV
jgi:conjugative relaxase-like TrwC/TraI family protein